MTSGYMIKALKASDYRVTGPRRCVIEVLEENDGHMTSTDILEAIAARDPDIGRSSVFRTLDLLTRLGLIHPVYLDSAATPTYVLMEDGSHHHIICRECGRLFHFDDCGLSDLIAQLEREHGIKATGHLVEIYALCETCR